MWKSEKKIEIISDEYSYTSGYFTANKWVDSDTIILGRAKKNENKEMEIVKYSVSSNEMTVLDDSGSSDWVVFGDKVYSNNGFTISEIDVQTKEKKIIYTDEYCTKCKEEGTVKGEVNRMNGVHITGDGKYVSVYVIKQKTSFLRINVATGECEEFFTIGFEAPFAVADHLMPCPTNNDLYFFAHEGITFYVSNRLWLYDIKEKKAWNIAKQRMDSDGNLGDCFGHEMWAKDGKGLYFVKYICSPLKDKGICYADVLTGKSELCYSGFNYWHVSTSEDRMFLASDTQTGKDYSEVIAIDKSDNSETLIDEALTNWTHPCHPHPQYSPDSSKLVYNVLNKKANTCYVKIALRS